ncbi:hypothetical protein HRbin39_00003 [bacterium HR39]|nr:hypothetical protein HRbin39_00003 [bacterium HR39]
MSAKDAGVPRLGPELDAASFERIAREEVPYAALLDFTVPTFSRERVRVRFPVGPLLLRPGGSVCGPALFAAADIALWGLVMAWVGRADLAVTVDLDVRFLAKARGKVLVAEARPVRAGRTLITGEVRICAEEEP